MYIYSSFLVVYVSRANVVLAIPSRLEPDIFHTLLACVGSPCYGEKHQLLKLKLKPVYEDFFL